jgi:Lon protease-like protein
MAMLRIPIFPLNLVLFPGNSLPLHIFEPRYKTMIRDSMDNRTPFGIVLATENGLARIGCTAEVINLLKTYDDGRMDIETVGLFAFRIEELHQENPLLEATIESLEDDLSPSTPDNPIVDAGESDPYAALAAKQNAHTDAETAAEILDLYATCHSLLHGELPAPFDNLPGTALSYQIAARLPLDPSIQQELLEIRAERARRAKLAERLREFLPQLSNIRQRQYKANSNGHNVH